MPLDETNMQRLIAGPIQQLRDQHPDRVSAILGMLMGGQAVRVAQSEGEAGEYAELWADVEWTEAAASYIRAGEFRYISPEWSMDYTSEKTKEKIGFAVLALGLVNRPFFAGMADIVLPEGQVSCPVQVFSTGVWHHPWYGTFKITATDFDTAIVNQALVFGSVAPESPHPATEMMVDYNHGSLGQGPETAKAAGWVRGRKLFVEKPLRHSQPEAAPAVASIPAPQQQLTALPTRESPGTQAASTTDRRLDMDEQLIRGVLGLADDAAVTADHQTQALAKLHDDNVRLMQPMRMAVRTADGEATVTPDEVVGRVVLQADDYAAMLAMQPKEGEVVMKRTDVDALKAAATTATQKLVDAEIAQVLDAAQGEGRVLPAEREDLVRLAAMDMGLFRSMVARRPVIVVLGEQGSDEQLGAPASNDVGEWVAMRERELLAAGTKPGAALSAATREASTKFPASAFDSWRYGDKTAPEAEEATAE